MAKSGKSQDKRPARSNYWASGRLKARKIRNLMRFCRMTREAAEKLWVTTRTTRLKKKAATT